MLLIDANNVFIEEAQKYHAATRQQPSMSEVRHMCTMALVIIMKKFRQYGEVVLANDSKHYWRRDFFPHYKGNRKKSRDKSTLDWKQLYKHFNAYREELKEHFPLKYIEVDGAEADDVIAVLSLRVAASGEKVLIYSSDTDNLQLQNYHHGIDQFSAYKKKLITPVTEKYNLFEHVVKGDSGDGIPNIHMPSDHFMQESPTRQKSITSVAVGKWQQFGMLEPEKFCEGAMLDRFNENRTLIDYTMIPDKVRSDIIQAYENTKANKMKFFSYLVEHKMTSVIKELS